MQRHPELGIGTQTHGMEASGLATSVVAVCFESVQSKWNLQCTLSIAHAGLLHAQLLKHKSLWTRGQASVQH